MILIAFTLVIVAVCIAGALYGSDSHDSNVGRRI
jgi:hypothetical protein